MAWGASQQFAGAGFFETLGDGFACFSHEGNMFESEKTQVAGILVKDKIKKNSNGFRCPSESADTNMVKFTGYPKWSFLFKLKSYTFKYLQLL